MEGLGVLVIGCLLGLIPASIARNKGRSFGAWWLYGFLFFIIALPHSLLIAPDVARIDEQKLAVKGNRKCPFCAEIIKQEANTCPHCRQGIEPIANDSTSPRTNIAYDHNKWAALVKYDADIAVAAEHVQPLGPHWHSGFAPTPAAFK